MSSVRVYIVTYNMGTCPSIYTYYTYYVKVRSEEVTLMVHYLAMLNQFKLQGLMHAHTMSCYTQAYMIRYIDKIYTSVHAFMGTWINMSRCVLEENLPCVSFVLEDAYICGYKY